jgi:hypothetical protein
VRGLVESGEGVMSDGDIETYQAGGMWHTHVVGEPCVLSSHFGKRDAEVAGDAFACGRRVGHIVRSLLGRVQFERGYDQEDPARC